MWMHDGQCRKKTYSPGEKGQIAAVYNFSGHVGALHKTIAITTNDHPQQVVALEIRVFVGDLLQVQPSLVSWRIGDEKLPKTVQLVATKEPVQVTKASSSNPPLCCGPPGGKKAGQQYSIQITPSDTNQKESAKLVLSPQPPTARPTDILFTRWLNDFLV